MSNFQRGDVVSLSRAQTNKVTVISVPVSPGEIYSVTLPINGTPKLFAYTSSMGQSLSEIADGLVAVLTNEQTNFVATKDPMFPTEVVIFGPLGESFDMSVSTNLTALQVTQSILAIDHRTGEIVGPIRLLEVTDTLERLREFVTRDRDGNTQVKNQLQGREIGSSNVFDFDASQVLTILHTEGR